ncbi:Pyrroline-5-carboxylate reductase [Cercospora beticola]|uniref:Pyrroline-5-carboxylate reductase n=1 Tax=Cercospora beticola TaxID=122368 RepID=A0A2G5HG44_CERBT|nr:Pyrroline-5-carboxylate reductase [Cercospora beticola]PIA91499.1 Pyrroline-5-carboxylate reductase [Cercospora beticola]
MDSGPSATEHRISAATNTLAILGCGALGTSILLGLLSQSSKPDGNAEANQDAGIPTRFVACVRREAAADSIKLKATEAGFCDQSKIDIKVRSNVEGVTGADIVVLAVQPHLLDQLFQEPGMRAALSDKIIVSVIAGVTVQQIRSKLERGSESKDARAGYSVVRVMPNINCFVRQSTTVIERGSVGEDVLQIVSRLFECVDKVFFTEPSTMDACTALCGSTPAFFTVILEGLVEGAIATGLKPDDALQMVSHAMMGTASLVKGGWSTRAVRHGVTSPGGSTIQGVLALEEGGVRWTFAKALRVAASGAAKLGSKENVSDLGHSN